VRTIWSVLSPRHLYNCLGYCYGEIYQLEQARKLNIKAEEIARMLMEKYPVGRSNGPMVWRGRGGSDGNLFDQGDHDTAWKRLKSLEEESRSADLT